MKLDFATRELTIKLVYYGPALSGKTIFGLSNKNRGQFFALDAATGTTLWLSKGREADNASIIRAGNYLLLSTSNSELIVTVADSAMWAHPAFVGRTIIVKDVDKLTAWSF